MEKDIDRLYHNIENINDTVRMLIESISSNDAKLRTTQRELERVQETLEQTVKIVERIDQKIKSLTFQVKILFVIYGSILAAIIGIIGILLVR